MIQMYVHEHLQKKKIPEPMISWHVNKNVT